MAADLPADVRQALADVRTDVEGARWTPKEQLHLTLRFLGDTEPSRIRPLLDELGKVTAEPIPLRLHGLDAFPSRRKPRVLVARLEESRELASLQRSVEAAARAAGAPADDRPFRPHVTLARLKAGRSAALNALLATTGPDRTFTLAEFSLYSSELRPAGAVHERLAAFTLGGR